MSFGFYPVIPLASQGKDLYPHTLCQACWRNHYPRTRWHPAMVDTRSTECCWCGTTDAPFLASHSDDDIPCRHVVSAT
ncbi:hypothetical protein [Yinghuangia soli]|uniref:Uncharacterized protein n=1 Tax=Yinghuangia soli TaxID=2908204 RepID=A0AA41Q8W6_9ACTN|nr:hypothetical protein [Yinghuangia soli]MCF2533763.1 hypothetical protein [Yinghuangia soli]